MTDVILRHKNRRYCSIPLDLLQDARLSHAAVRLGAWLACRPDDWIVHKTHAQKMLALSQHGWKSALRELRTTGYLTTTPRKSLSGKMCGQDYLFDSAPRDEAATVGS